MRSIKNALGLVSILTIVLGFSITNTGSQEPLSPDSQIATFSEQFDGNDKYTMLGGQINFHNQKSKWLVYVSEESLVMENRVDPNSIHHDDIEWIRYPDSDVLSDTNGAIISVTVEAQNEGRGGAGFIVGSGDKGIYWMFSVDADGRFHIFNKNSRKAKTVHSAKHEAILVNQPNRVSYRKRGDNLAFFANGVEIIQVPFGQQKLNSRRGDRVLGVGLAAFGVGTYIIDDVEIAQLN